MGQNSQCWKKKRRIHVNTSLQNEWMEQSVSGMTQDGFVKVIWQTETGSEINLLCWCHSDSECLDDVSSSSHDFFWRCLSTLDCFPNSKQRHDLRSHALTNRSAHQLEIFQISYASSHLYDRSFWYSGGPWFPRHTVFHTCHTISGTQHFAFYNWCRLSAWPEHHWTMWLSEKGLSFCRFDILICHKVCILQEAHHIYIYMVTQTMMIHVTKQMLIFIKITPCLASKCWPA